MGKKEEPQEPTPTQRVNIYMYVYYTHIEENKSTRNSFRSGFRPQITQLQIPAELFLENCHSAEGAGIFLVRGELGASVRNWQPLKLLDVIE